MRCRRNILPHTLSDVCCFSLIFTFIPITFIFAITVVLPDFYDTGGLISILIWIAGSFVLFNIIGNLLACMIVDTSVKAIFLRPTSQSSLRKQWHYCSTCEVIAPPRSWHCRVCRTCILKRDHHCLFTGCCIGHYNLRYFLIFLIYMAIGSGFATLHISIYFWWLHADTYMNTNVAVRMIFPMLMFAMNATFENLYLLIYLLNVVAFAYTSVLLVYHFPLISVGAVSYEKDTTKFNLGWRKNIEMIFGKRKHLVWLSPFIKSELPNDGAHWDEVIEQSNKNR